MVLRQAVQLAAAVPRPVLFSLLMTASHCSHMRSEARLIITCCGAGRAGRSNISSDSELSSRSTSRSPTPPPLKDPSPARIANEALKNSNLPAQVGPQVLQQNALHDVAAVAMHEWACGSGGELCLRETAPDPDITEGDRAHPATRHPQDATGNRIHAD